MADPGAVSTGTWQTWDVSYAVSGAGYYTFVLDTPATADTLTMSSSESIRKPVLRITTYDDLVSTTIEGEARTTDTKILASQSNTNFGDNTTAVVLGTGADASSLLLRFDTSSIATDRAVATAKIQVYVEGTSSDTLKVYEAEQSWTEGGATWNVWTGASNWQTAGAKGSNDRDKTLVGKFTPNAINQLMDITLNPAGIEMVQRWIANPSSNRGLILEGTGGDDATLRTSEYSGSSSDPKLVVQYRGPCQSPFNELVSGTRAINVPSATPPGYPSDTGSYYDEWYGTKIIRVTGSSAVGHHGYGYWPPFNADDTRFVIYLDDGPGQFTETDGWRFYKFDPLSETVTATNVYVPSDCAIGEQVNWHPTVPSDFYCTKYGARDVVRCTVTDTTVTCASRTPPDPPGGWYEHENFFYQPLLADDGDTMTFVTRSIAPIFNTRAIVYRWSTNEIVYVNDPAVDDLNEVHIDGAGRYINIIGTSAFVGEVHTACHIAEDTCVSVTYANGAGHWVDGRGFTWGDDTEDPNSAAGLKKRNYGSFGTAVGGWHYKYGGSGVNQDFARYHSAHSSHNAKDGRWFATSPFFDTNDTAMDHPWVSWEKEILATDGTNWVRRLAHHHSDWQDYCGGNPTCTLQPGCTCNTDTEYWDMPKASLSYDGKWLGYSSDYDEWVDSEDLESDFYILKMPVICKPQ